MRSVRSIVLICCLIIASSVIVTAQDTPIECPGPLPSRLYAAEYTRVLPGRANNLRMTPGVDGYKIGELPPLSIVRIFDGPRCVDGYLWWYVEFQTTAEAGAWTVEGNATEYWLEPYEHPDPIRLFDQIDALGDTVDLEYRGVSFTVDTAWTSWVGVDHVVPNVISYSERSPNSGNPKPAGLSFIIADATGDAEAIQIQVYALADYANLPDGLPDTFETLQGLLDIDPANIELSPAAAETLLLPDWNAPLLFQDAFRRLDFQNGRGLSYFAAYAYGVEPIGALVYTFTGLTSDGLYYITAQQLTRTELLPEIDTESFDSADWEEFYENFDDYRNGIADTLRAASPDDISPSVAAFDALIASLKIELPQQ